MLKIAPAPGGVKDISPLNWGGGGQNRIDPILHVFAFPCVDPP